MVDGVLFVLWGSRLIYRLVLIMPALLSARTAHSSPLHFALVTGDVPLCASVLARANLTHVVQLIYAKDLADNATRARFKMPGLLLSPFDRTLYLDVDTHVCTPALLLEPFALLRYYDAAMTFAPHQQNELRCARRAQTGQELVYNTGVIYFNRTALPFIANWLALSYNHAQRKGCRDQSTLHEAIRASPVKVASLSAVYNFRKNDPFPMWGRVVLVHNPYPLAAQIAECARLNSVLGERTVGHF